MELSKIHTLNFTTILSKSKNIISSKYTHFITLSLFFLPFSLSLIITPTLSRRLSDQPLISYDTSDHQKLVTSYLLYTLIVHVIALCAIATITYSTHHAFVGKSIKLSYSLKSLIFSFFPLVWTAIVAYVLIVLITLAFLILVVGILILVCSLGFVVIDYNSVYILWGSAIMAAILIVIIVYFNVNWSLAFVVVVVESKWGFAALMRSSYLVKGMRLVSLLLLMCFGVCGGFIVWICDTILDVTACRMLGSVFIMMFLLMFTAANAVLYSYCKGLHDELVIEDVEGSDHEYSSLPSDGEKVVDVVNVV